jgi:hypothetical protein
VAAAAVVVVVVVAAAAAAVVVVEPRAACPCIQICTELSVSPAS